jgi:hypothetical protein
LRKRQCPRNGRISTNARGRSSAARARAEHLHARRVDDPRISSSM